MRALLSILIPHSAVNTFWGRGISQGHSEALRRIPGVLRAVEYTVPRSDALTLASLVCHKLEDTDRHTRVCYIAAEKGKEDSVKRQVLSMENYFLGYETEVHFIDESDPLFDVATLSHRGRIYAVGKSGVYGENKYSAFFDLELTSNPELTAHIALVGARVGHTLRNEKRYGAYTLLDLPLSVLCESCGKNVNDYL
jgi:diaminopimelate dehydrogenase